VWILLNWGMTPWSLVIVCLTFCKSTVRNTEAVTMFEFIYHKSNGKKNILYVSSKFLEEYTETKKVNLSLSTPWRHTESGGIAPVILKFSTRWRWVVSFTPRYLLGKSPRYRLNMSQGGPQSQSGRFGEDKNLLFLVGNRKTIPRLSCRLVTILTELLDLYGGMRGW
jgi:hypothetical protein